MTASSNKKHSIRQRKNAKNEANSKTETVEENIPHDKPRSGMSIVLFIGLLFVISIGLLLALNSSINQYRADSNDVDILQWRERRKQWREKQM